MSEQSNQADDISAIAKAAWDEAWKLAFGDGLSAGHPLGHSSQDCDTEWADSEVVARIAKLAAPVLEPAEPKGMSADDRVWCEFAAMEGNKEAKELLAAQPAAPVPVHGDAQKIIALLEASATAWEDMAGNFPNDADASGRMQARASESRGNVERIRAMLAAQPAAPAEGICSKCGYSNDELCFECDQPAEPAPSEISEDERLRNMVRAAIALDNHADRQGVALSDEEVKAVIQESIGFDWQADELQTVNADDLLFVARAILRASSSRAEVEIPEGYALAPKEPTPEMRAAAMRCHFGYPYQIDAMYRAMLAAAEAPNGEVK